MNYIKEFSVKKLWGHKNYPLVFDDDVNIIIGPNASGKTTLINILYDSLSGNFVRLFRTEFAEVVIKLTAFKNDRQCELRITKSKENLQIHIDNKKHTLPLAPFAQSGDEFAYATMQSVYRRRFTLLNTRDRKLRQQLRQLVPAVWLPVSRRLPIAKEEELEDRRLHHKPLESVDECLERLLERLQENRLNLNIKLSELLHQFQRHALENILYDKQRDQNIFHENLFTLPSEDDKQALLKAFQYVGLIDKKMEKRINEHFKVAHDTLSRLRKNEQGIDIDTISILPLINRTNAIVHFAQELENKREKLFEKLHNFESIVNSFLNDKEINVSDAGTLRISPKHSGDREVTWRQLSSGEKQILILLTQALLSEKEPVVYVADEPELSLHVDWQEKLLLALTQLAGRCQFIVATHSPDIVSDFGEKVIDLAGFE